MCEGRGGNAGHGDGMHNTVYAYSIVCKPRWLITPTELVVQCASHAADVSYASGITSSACSAVASRMTGGATPACQASSQRWAHRHQRSPGFSPANRSSGRGVLRSLPWAREKSRNAWVTLVQTTCCPASSLRVRQQPSRKYPVNGSKEQARKGPPSTLRPDVSSTLIHAASRVLCQQLSPEASSAGPWRCQSTMTPRSCCRARSWCCSSGPVARRLPPPFRPLSVARRLGRPGH